jgi:hypothetical protein
MDRKTEEAEADREHRQDAGIVLDDEHGGLGVVRGCLHGTRPDRRI